VPRDEAGRRTPSQLPRIAAVAAVLVAVGLVAYIFFLGGDESYKVNARFQNAGQLVYGNLVEIDGVKVGSVTARRITEDGQAEIEFTVDGRHAPLRRGTRAVIRQGSQSSVANRYIELHLPSEKDAGDVIPDGGRLETSETTTGVELDQLFYTLNRRTRIALRGFYEGNYRLYAGRGEQANRGWIYLNPNLAGSTALFRELTRDRPVLERFLVNSSRFVTNLAARRDDLAALVGNLNRTTRALGSEKEALAELISRFPDFMRTANTTYVNLRATLDDLDPLVEASKPVARKLRPYLGELRPFAREAVPTVRNLRIVLRRAGVDNDLLELNRLYPPLVDIAVERRRRTVDAGGGPVDVGERRGAFPELTESLRESAPIVAHGRPYTVDFFGWADDFSHTGAADALGSISRSHNYFNSFSLSSTGPVQIAPEQRGETFKQLAKLGQYKRCPGAAEEAAPDGSNVWTEEEQRELDCVEGHRATGPVRR
jgi:phospholipid/cholesterol/gamma-HCH transport system substrate-binding protein